ncbi:MAG: RHS repeat-associated core domain-containing protein [Chloroflexi bacterium]|nr:RHS repeat-associated core domain-containing protein [Chloroflexota bacterium]
MDQGRISAHFGAEGAAAYDVLEDVNSDGNINSIDLQQQAQEFGTCAATGPNTGNGRYSYNGDGLRIHSRTFGPAANDDFVWDLGSSLPVVLQDVKTQGGATTTTTFLYGLGLISATDSGGATSYYLADGLGSTTQLTDSAGAVSESYTYDVFGARKTATEPSVNDFRYTGQQDDRSANRGLYYLRARFYDPALGRFLTGDPMPFVQRYSYTDNNPVNLVDPAGTCPWGVPGSACRASAAVNSGLKKVGDGEWVVIHAAGRVATYCGRSDRIFECYERFEVGSAGMLVAAGGTAIVGVACLGLGVETFGGSIILCAAAAPAFLGGLYGGSILGQKAIAPWHEGSQADGGQDGKE